MITNRAQVPKWLNKNEFMTLFIYLYLVTTCHSFFSLFWHSVFKFYIGHRMHFVTITRRYIMVEDNLVSMNGFELYDPFQPFWIRTAMHVPRGITHELFITSFVFYKWFIYITRMMSICLLHLGKVLHASLFF